MFRRLLLLSMLVLLGGCASFQRTIDIPYERMQAALERKFPFQDRYLELLEIQATGPHLVLLPEENRLRVDVALAATERLLRLGLRGSLSVSFAPKYEPADASIRLADVRVEKFDLQGLPQGMREPIQRFGPFFAQRVLEGATLHQFSKPPGYVPQEVRVTFSGLRVTLAPQ